MSCNAFTVGAVPETNLVAFVRPSVPVCVRQQRQFFVDLRKNDILFLEVDRPVVIQDSFVRSVSLEAGARPRLISRRAGEVHTFLYIESQAGIVLQTKGSPQKHFEKTVTWLGADGPGLVGMEGRWIDPKKRQLFMIAEGESVLFFDSSAEVTKITAQQSGQTPILSRATNQEVAKYILGEAEKRGAKDYSARTWAYHAIQELGVQSYIDAFQKLYPDLHPSKR